MSNKTLAAPTANDDPAAFAALPRAAGARVSLSEIGRLALDSLLANKVRALLTMLGVIIGVAAVVALLALGEGASNAITGQVRAIGTNMLVVQPGSPSSRGPGSSSTGTVQTLTLADAEAITALRLPVTGVAPVFSAPAPIVAPAADTTGLVTGATAAYPAVNNLTLAAGQFFDESHVRAASPVVVLGADLATDLFGDGAALGQAVRVGGQHLRVIGVLTAQGSGSFGASVDGQAIVPISVAQQRLFGGRTPDGNGYRVSSIALSVVDAGQMPAIQTRIETLLRQRHRLASDGAADDFAVRNQAAMLSILATITTMLTAFLGAVAGISLLVGGIGIMNIMLVSVSERTREIGLRKAVGARDRDILLQFMVEALALSLAGGVIGLVLGSLVPLGVTLAGYFAAPVTPTAALTGVGFALAVGAFFGIYPAQRAARLNPIEALRHE